MLSPTGNGPTIPPLDMPVARPVAAGPPAPPRQDGRMRTAVIFAAVLTLLFAVPLTRLVSYTLSTEIHSHVVLVPFIAAYLFHQRRRLQPGQPALTERGARLAAVATGALGLAALIARQQWASALSLNDELALWAFAYVAFLVAGGFVCLGLRGMREAAFPAAFMLFLIPLPDAVVAALEHASMLASADVAAAFIKWSGTPNARNGTTFGLPGITLWVAPECSGIRSSWVLFITATVASHLFLESRWRRLWLVLFVIPLGLIRNGFRVFVIAMLCVYIGPHMLDSAIHHQGGPIFFALSLGPLFLLAWWLRRTERRLLVNKS